MIDKDNSCYNHAISIYNCISLKNCILVLNFSGILLSVSMVTKLKQNETGP